MLSLREGRKVIGLIWLLFLTAFLTACNSGSTLTPTTTKSHPLVGTKSGNLNVVASLRAPDHVQSGKSQLIYANDLLQVDVFQVDELDRTIRVDTKGMITMPLIGAVRAAKRSVPELETELKRRYAANYLQSPEISVFVKESSGQMVVIDGSFKRPGLFPITKQTTLLRLVAEAGGLTETADENKLFVYRKYEFENQVAQFSVEDIRKGRKPDPVMYAGDVVVAFPSDTKVAVKNLKDALGIASSAARVAMPF